MSDTEGPARTSAGAHGAVPGGGDHSDDRRRRRWHRPVGRRRQLPLLIGLALLWVLLWDDLSWANVVNGAVIALFLTRVFHLPPAELSGRVNPYRLAVFLLHFVVDLVRSSLQVAALAFRFGHTPRNAVVAVRLRTSSDLLLTAVANTLTLIPGSSIVDVDRLNSTLYVHLLDVRDDEEVERNRRHILAMEERLIRAVGGREENASLQRHRGATASRYDDGGAQR